MQLVRKLLSLTRSHAGRNQKIRGLSTAELVGIIVIIGILGAVGGTYIGSLVTTANTNAINSNVSSLNSVTAAMLAAGVPFTTANNVITGVSAGPNYAAQGGSWDAAGFVTALNAGVNDPNNAGVVYQLTPNVKTPASYAETVATDANGGITAITWAAAQGATSP